MQPKCTFATFTETLQSGNRKKNNNNCRDGKSLFTLTSMSKKKQRVTFMSPTHSYESDELKGIVGELSYQHV